MLRNEQFKKEKKLMCHLGISFAHLRESTVTLISFPVLYEFYFIFSSLHVLFALARQGDTDCRKITS